MTQVKIYGRNDSVYVHKEVELDVRDVNDASYTTDEYGRPAIEILLTENGKERITKLIKATLHKQLAIFLDGKLIMAPMVGSPNMKDKLSITGEIQESEAHRIVARLKAK